MKDNLILRDAKRKIVDFNQIGLRYNLIAKEVYHERRICADPFSQSFTRHIIAGLISFDMGRMMGKVEEAYEFEGNGFGSRLKLKLGKISPNLERLMNLSLTDIDLHKHKQDILEVYSELAADGEGALNNRGRFHVGATKILHFLNPELFIIVDSNAAKAFKETHHVKAGYSSQRYLERMELARQAIQEFPLDE